MKHLLLSITLVLSTGLGLVAQDIDKAKLTAYLDSLAKHDKFMGSVAIAKEGKLVYAYASGFADVEAGQKATANTRYRIGSISKTFTAALVFKAIEAKKLALSTTLDAFYPSIENANKITIGNLLNHRSGIHNFTNDSAYLEYYTRSVSEKELVTIIQKGGSDFAPNSEADYSNSNYVLLSLILQKVYAKPYAALLKEQLIDPLKLSRTTFGAPINPKNDEAFSYSYMDGWEQEAQTDMSVPLGAGSVVSTPTDLCTFAQALFTGKVVSQESLKQMMSLQDDYGMGLFVTPFGGRTSYGHTGAIDGFSSALGYFPEEKVAFAVISNGNNYNQNNVNIAVLSTAFNVPYEIPSFKQLTLSAEELAQYTGVYSSPQLPIKVTVMQDGEGLQAQATGQSSFPLEASGAHVFRFDAAGIVLEFDPPANTMTLKQGGGVFVMTRE
jgi:CubicO group peptidase (beta-lactamase class C family)